MGVAVTIVSAALLLFLVMDPVGNIPLFLTTLKNINAKRQRIIILRELLIALVVLVVFMFTGKQLLGLLQISEPSLTVAGGIILFLIALRMIFPPDRRHPDVDLDGEPFVVPLAIPLVAGPSAMASVMLIMSQDPGRWQEWLIALLIAWSISGFILFMASGLRKYLGVRGLIAIERLMGMVLTTIAVQMVMSGVKKFLV